tara:strand:- start:8 stop:370 length:363 start_codon:yes stop_codon:yes gene_type:complete
MIVNFIILGLIISIIDIFFLMSIKDDFYKQIKSVQGSNLEINYVGMIITYFLLTFGIYYFIILKKAKLLDAFLFGIVIYGAYEMTSLSILKNWTYKLAFIDTIWGGILVLLSTLVYRKIY